jgi:putative serine protease PepD
MRRLAIAVVAVLLALAGCTGSDTSTHNRAAATSDSPGSSGSAAQDLQTEYEQVIGNVLPSVVEIRTPEGLGSGVVYDDKGNIVTNAHVVGTAREFQVLSSGTAGPVAATLVGSFPANDLAVIRVTGSADLPPADFGDSDGVKVGQLVLAMGNPLGLEATVTNGIVSATGRVVSEPAGQGSPGATLPDVIQTSADINPGNSGGALVGLDSKVIGIPTLAAVDPRAGAAAPGLGFAIPSNQAKNIADQLIADGRVTHSGRAALGVRVTTVTDQQGKPDGVGVVEVTPGGPADKAGLQPGDVIVSVDGTATPTTQALGAVLAEHEPGDTVTVDVRRGNKQEELKVTLGELGG